MMINTRVRVIGALLIGGLTVSACRGGSVEHDPAEAKGVEAVRNHKQTAVAAFTDLWPTFTAGVSTDISAFGEYASCDDFSKTYGYAVHGVALSKDVARPIERVTAMQAALKSQGWAAAPTLDTLELLRANKGGMQLIMSTDRDRFVMSLDSACASVSNDDIDALRDETTPTRGIQEIPGIPSRLLP